MSAYDHKGDWPAYPIRGYTVDASGALCGETVQSDGMTLRQYAAIKLRVPDSGTDWLDDMIRQSLRDEFAAKAMQGMVSSEVYADGMWEQSSIAEQAYEIADAMLATRGKP